MSDEEALQRLLDREAILETVYSYSAGLDGRDWDLYRSIFTDVIELDFTSYFGSGEPMTMTADDWVHAGRLAREDTETEQGVVLGLKATHHLLTNPRITIDHDRALCITYMQAEHFLPNLEGDSFHTVGGYYTIDLIRTPEGPFGWKIPTLKLTVTWQRGNKHIMGGGLLAENRGTS